MAFELKTNLREQGPHRKTKKSYNRPKIKTKTQIN